MKKRDGKRKEGGKEGRKEGRKEGVSIISSSLSKDRREESESQVEEGKGRNHQKAKVGTRKELNVHPGLEIISRG